MEEKKIVSIIPVSPLEPSSVIKNSFNALSDLKEPEGYDLEFYYVIDTNELGEDERIEYLENLDDERFKYMARQPGEGKRAGAINDVLEVIGEQKFVALFDIDSRPEENFFVTSMDKFEDNVFMVTSPREIINSNRNFVTAMVDVEYRFLRDMQNLLDYGSGFNHFNGLIGILDGEYLRKEKLNSERMCEDTDFSERAYMDGKRISINKNSVIKEQSVTNLEDLYNQKIRWMNGAWEGLENYTISMLRSEVPLKVKGTWLISMVSPFFSALFSFFAPLYGLRLLFSDKKPKSILKSVAGLFAIAWLISVCGLVSGAKRFLGKEIKWTASKRDDI